MPPFNTTPPLLSLIGRDTIVHVSNNTIEPAVQVICAWPVSGQYGLGTRIIYYILVATCVLARRTEWLRNACLAAALLLPAVAAIHAVVLAAVHVETAVDMDIYGAFQICSIGILAAPITVYNSKTYFNDPGRNIIFIWTSLLLAGMLSLTVEFFRTEPHSCSFDDMGTPIDPFNLLKFPYGSADCGLQCVFGEGGPYSPIRRDPTAEPAVIPVPHRLSFSAVTLLAAGSSIPPVLTLIFTWEKILEINWKRRFAQEEISGNDLIEGTNGATPKMITFINGTIRSFLSSIQIPVFSGIVIVLLVLGELNFSSRQVTYQTEPISSVGQWANLVATALVVLGSLFYVNAQTDGDEEKEDAGSNHSQGSRSPRPRPSTQCNSDQESIRSGGPVAACDTGTVERMDSYSIHDPPTPTQSHDHRVEASELESVTMNMTYGPVSLSISNKHRNKVATLLSQFGEYLGTPAPDRYDNSVFQEGKAEFPEIPGEAGRVAGFEDIRDWYRSSHQQEDKGNIMPGLSRIGSAASIRGFEGSSADRDTSPSRPPRSPSRSSTVPAAERESSPPELSRITTSPVTSSASRARRDTLDVPHRPKPVHIRNRNSSASSSHSPIMILNAEGSPKIVVSAEPEETSDATPTRTSPPLDSP
ncbi:hypothetical protein F5B22DRAFT_601269 [Xylaria bambusicola]|uniref:uncharacterized protein n=1 Tax=Xylaria bambusicola TaxID=326684 RepID=UPI0020086F72|nr:uncharacterized protein F5B22DRAFT_601269 [Xylaria bambusicola]KAI0517973.1 hypothetical protein F5B22DRAFT_601269 [Xylaria bambusicola]